MTIVHTTAFAGMGVQVVAFVIGLAALGKARIAPSKLLLKDALNVEMVVNTVQLLVYGLLLARIPMPQWTVARYGDWFITTPLMLFTTCMLLHYESQQEWNFVVYESVRIREFARINARTLAAIMITNTLMLLFGYLGETKQMDPTLALGLGLVFFGISFGIMYARFARRSMRGRRLYAIMLTVWTLYGAAYLLPPVSKNVAFNMLDVISKNFFGIYLAWILMQK